MHASRVGLCMTIMVAFCEYVSPFILAQSQATKSSVTGHPSEDIEKKIYFLTKLLQKLNSHRDIDQSVTDRWSVTDTKSSDTNGQLMTVTDSQNGAINSNIDIVNPPENTEIKVHTMVGDEANTQRTKEQESLASVTVEEKDNKDVVSLSKEDISYIKNGFKAVAEIVRLFDEETGQNSIKVEKKDFAILPPASEWCRLMGFRRCRYNHS